MSDIIKPIILDETGKRIASALENMGSTAFPGEAKVALLTLLQHVAYIDDSGNDYYTDFMQALISGVDQYTITYALTNAVSSNTDASCNLGDSYTTTISAASGYELVDVVVTMGGRDVTSQYYNTTTGVINISNVIGDISITAASYSLWHVDSADENSPLAFWNGGSDLDSSVTPRKFYLNNGNYDTRQMCVSTRSPYPLTEFGIWDGNHVIASASSGYYPIRIPSGATGVSVSVIPSTNQCNLSIYSASMGGSTAQNTDGWAGLGNQSMTFNTNVLNALSNEGAFINILFRNQNNADYTTATKPSRVVIDFTSE